MDPELKRTLDEIRAFAKDNHDMLRAIRRGQWYSFITTVVFWLVVVIAPIYLYQQYIEPLIAKFSATSGVTTSGPFGLPTSSELQKLINSFKAGK